MSGLVVEHDPAHVQCLDIVKTLLQVRLNLGERRHTCISVGTLMGRFIYVYMYIYIYTYVTL